MTLTRWKNSCKGNRCGWTWCWAITRRDSAVARERITPSCCSSCSTWCLKNLVSRSRSLISTWNGLNTCTRIVVWHPRIWCRIRSENWRPARTNVTGIWVLLISTRWISIGWNRFTGNVSRMRKSSRSVSWVTLTGRRPFAWQTSISVLYLPVRERKRSTSFVTTMLARTRFPMCSRWLCPVTRVWWTWCWRIMLNFQTKNSWRWISGDRCYATVCSLSSGNRRVRRMALMLKRIALRSLIVRRRWWSASRRNATRWNAWKRWFTKNWIEVSTNSLHKRSWPRF